MKLALAQINPTVGDLEGNSGKVEAFARRARDAGVGLVVFPELCISGYPPRDLLFQEGFVKACAEAARVVGQKASRGGMTVVFGCPLPAESHGRKGRGGVHNSLLVYRDGAYVEYYDKRLLPTYDVFDEDRYFEPGDRAVVIDVGGYKVGLSICEDLWRGEDVGFAGRYQGMADPVEELVRAGARLIVNPSASPFVVGKGARHRELLRGHAMKHGVYVAAVNQVGGNDELVFDGHAAVFAPSGSLVAAGAGFDEDLVVCEVDLGEPSPRALESGDPLLSAGDEELVYRALVLGVRDYCGKTGFKSVVMGLSGGIDSAVCAVLAAGALGPEKVHGVSMPSRYSSAGSRDDAGELARRLGIGLTTVPIEGPFAAFEASLAGAFAGRAADVTEENMQSRVRGTLLMALSNKFGHLLLTTGNKSELAVGYCTLYGDMNGGLAVLSDLSKGWVYRLARWMNENHDRLGFSPAVKGPPIPEASISKPPSAELRPDQTDQDTLPPYDVLDEVIQRYVEERQSGARIVEETGLDAALVSRVLRMIDLSEFKRKQAAIGLKVTGVAFGTGRRWPIVQRYRP